MKYLLFILPLVFFGLAGCSRKDTSISELPISNTTTSTLEETGKEQTLGGKYTSTIYITGIYSPIIIANNLLSFSGVFSLKIPQGLENREYVSNKTPVTNGYMEYIGFNNNDKTKSFSLHVNNLSGIIYSDKEVCGIEYVDGYITKSEKTKIIQNRNVYVNYATLMVSAPDIEPFKVLDTQICFVDNNILYKFSASNYTPEYMNKILDSFTFLD